MPDNTLFALEHVPPPGPWVKDAACRDHDPSIFFPEPFEDPSEARAICQTCPVMEECAEYAIPHGALLGVWGGLTWSQRRLRREKRRDAKRLPPEREPVSDLG